MKKLSSETIGIVVMEMARRQGHDLNGQDLLQLRTSIAQVNAAKRRHFQRMTADDFEWRKPQKMRR